MDEEEVGNPGLCDGCVEEEGELREGKGRERVGSAAENSPVVRDVKQMK